MIRIQIPDQLQQYCRGVKEISSAANDIQGVFEDLENRFPALYCCVCDEAGNIRRHVNVFINTTHLRECPGKNTSLNAGDVVFILPAVSGG